VSLKEQLAQRIRDNGPLSVADYMAACVEHYYASRDPFGSQGDFTTSPEISQIFGELLGAWVADCWQRLGEPRCVLVELGPGRGTLMKDLLRATQNVKGFHDATDILLVEMSPVLRALQKKTLKKSHPRIRWQQNVEKLPALPLLLIANEFFDALPIHQHLRENNQWQERKVALHGNALRFIPPGKVLGESSPASLNVAARIASHITTHSGAALIIDYGYTGGSQGDTLQALQAHKKANPLAHPGEADLTAHVDFDALLHTARGRGAQSWNAVDQGTFLRRLGAELRATALCKKASPEQQNIILSSLERLIAPHQMGSLFKAIAFTSFMDKPAGF